MSATKEMSAEAHEAANILCALSGALGPFPNDDEEKKVWSKLSDLNLDLDEVSQAYDRTLHMIKTGVAAPEYLTPSFLRKIGTVVKLNEIVQKFYPDFSGLKDPVLYMEEGTK